MTTFRIHTARVRTKNTLTTLRLQMEQLQKIDQQKTVQKIDEHVMCTKTKTTSSDLLV